jgi:hypothetical protein
MSLIRSCRQLVSNYIISNPALDVNGISLSEAILCTYPDVR